MNPIQYGCADTHGHAASIYILDVLEEKYSVFKGIELECHAFKNCRNKVNYFGTFDWERKEQKKEKDAPLFYFRDESFLSPKMMYIENCVRPFYFDKKISYFMCENTNSAEEFSSHICFLVTRKSIKLFRNNLTAFLLHDPSIKRCEFDIYKISWDNKYLVMENDKCHGHLKYTERVLTLE